MTTNELPDAATMAAKWYPNSPGPSSAKPAEAPKPASEPEPAPAAPPAETPTRRTWREEQAAMAAKWYPESPQPELPEPEAPPADATPAQPDPTPTTLFDERADPIPTTTFDESAYDSELISAYREAADGLGVETEVAQRMLEKVAPKFAERQAAQLDAMRDGWLEEARADPELADSFGFEQNAQTARSVVQRFGSTELTELLDTTGLGDHPALIRFALRVGRRLGNDL